MTVEYWSNNSGGHWWLSDKDWKKLEAAGWRVKWRTLEYDYLDGHYQFDEDGFPKMRPSNPEDTFYCEDGRFLGGLASNAFMKCGSLREAIQNFEKVTEKDACEEGCNCCGPPHSFSIIFPKGAHEYASGSDCLKYLFEKVPSSLREASEKLNEAPHA